VTTVSTLGTYGDLSGSPLVFRNKIINGGFDIWQRGISQTANGDGFGYGSDDRWGNYGFGSTKVHSQQLFTLGQMDVPGNPRYFSRTVVTSAVGAANSVRKYQNIESVRTLAGQTATLSFWAKADATKNIAVEFVQGFGSGGGASTAITGIGIATFALTTSWQRFTTTVSLPSITGKVLGTDNKDYLGIVFWFDSGSDFNSRTNSLGQQSGTFDIANVQLEAGPVATPFEQRPVGTELTLCQRYYETGNVIISNNAAHVYLNQWYKVTKRTSSPVISVSAGGATWLSTADGFYNSSTSSSIATATFTASAEL